jgi:hypothetical protein
MKNYELNTQSGRPQMLNTTLDLPRKQIYQVLGTHPFADGRRKAGPNKGCARGLQRKILLHSSLWIQGQTGRRKCDKIDENESHTD